MSTGYTLSVVNVCTLCMDSLPVPSLWVMSVPYITAVDTVCAKIAMYHLYGSIIYLESTYIPRDLYNIVFINR